MITQQEVKERIYYNPSTRKFHWKTHHRKKKIDQPIPEKSVKIKGKMILTKKLAWCYFTGVYPTGIVIHQDRDKTNFSFDNLTRVSHSELYFRRQSVRQDNSVGVTGVSYISRSQTYAAYLDYKGIHYYLGSSKDLSEAVRLRWDAEVQFELPCAWDWSSAKKWLENRKPKTVSK